MLEQLTETLNRIESAAADVVARVAPWAAPAPTAYLVYNRTTTHLGWPGWIGIVAALVIETLGLAVTSTALTLYNYNKDKLKTDPDAPLILPVVLVILYFLAAEGLTVILDVAPKLAGGTTTALADWAPAIFPILSLAGVTTLAIRADHRRRLLTVQEAKEKRSSRRSGKRSPKRSVTGQTTGGATGQTVQPAGGVTGGATAEPSNLNALARANRVRRLNKQQALDALVIFLTDNPDASYRQAGEAVGRSKSWALGAVRELESDGRLRRNGDGIEVLE